jgi:hypothetical protein
MFPNLYQMVKEIVIPLQDKPDQLLWRHIPNGELQLKEAYSFKMQQYQDLRWAKPIWSIDILPFKSMMV